MTSTNQTARQYVINGREGLIRRLQDLPLIIEKLHQQNVFNSNEVSEIEAEIEKDNKTRKMVDWVIKKGEGACYQFLKILDFERKSVLLKQHSLDNSRDDLHTWICQFSFREEPEDYVHGPNSCHLLRDHLKTKANKICREWKQEMHCYGGKVQEKFIYTPLVLDTDSQKNRANNKIMLKSKKSKKPGSNKMRAYIPDDRFHTSPKDLLNSAEKSILLVGKPGIGKTTVVKQMLYLWAEGNDRNLDFMFYFDKNIVSHCSTTYTLENLLFDSFFKCNPMIRKNATEISQYLQEHSEKVTIIFDGISDFEHDSILLNVLQRDMLPEAKIVVTCRPGMESDEFSEWPTCTVYVQGFSEESIYNYFTQMSDNDADLVDSVVNNTALLSLCHVPMHAFMVASCCSYYKTEGAEKQCTASELYIQIFRHCIQKHANKKQRHLDGHIIECREKVLQLANFAFHASKSKTINMDCSCDEKGIEGAFLRFVSIESPGFVRTYGAFLHNTMQEFFSAVHLVQNPQELDNVLDLCLTEECKHMKHVIPFLCGLWSENNSPFLKCLFQLDQIKGTLDESFEKVLNTFLQDQEDEDAVAFICECLYEFQSSKACLRFLERMGFYINLSGQQLDPYRCNAVSYVIKQSTDTLVHLDLEHSNVPLSGLNTLMKHSKHLRDISTTLCQVWTVFFRSKQDAHLANLLQLCGNEVHLRVCSDQTVLDKAGELIKQSVHQIKLHLHCINEPLQLSADFGKTVSTWLQNVCSLQFTTNHSQHETSTGWVERSRRNELEMFMQLVLHQKLDIKATLKKVLLHGQDEESDFLLELYSHMKQYESETGSSVLPALQTVYHSAPEVWYIKLSERKASILLEVLKLHTEKKPVELIDCTDEESEVKTFLQCLPYISLLRFSNKEAVSEQVKFLLNLFHQASESERQTGVRRLELLTSLCTYSSFPYEDVYYCEKSDFLLELYSHMKQYESETGSSVLPALQTVYRSAPDVWYIKLSERKASILLEVLKLNTEKKPVELRGCTDEESEVKTFLQCLPYISQLRYSKYNVLYLNRVAADYGEETDLALLHAMDYSLTLSGVLSNQECRALGSVLGRTSSKLSLTLKPQAISLRGVQLLFGCTKRLKNLCLSESVISRMARAFQSMRCHRPLVIEELSMVLTEWSTQKLTKILSCLSCLLLHWTVEHLDLTECKIEAKFFISLMCYPEPLAIRLSKESLQQFAVLACEVKDGEMARFFLDKVGGDLTSCSLSWEEIIFFLQQQSGGISVNFKKSKITDGQAKMLLPLLHKVQFKRLSSSIVLSIVRTIYETGSTDCVSSLLASVENCINLNNRDLDSFQCAALCFTLQHCSNVSLNLMFTSIPESELESFIPLLDRVYHLSVDRLLLLRLLHCCCVSELQPVVTVVTFHSRAKDGRRCRTQVLTTVKILTALQNRLDFSCRKALDLSAETEDSILHLTTEDCRVISTAILRAHSQTELILNNCQIKDAGVEMITEALHSIKLCCSKAMLLQFLALFHVFPESKCVRRAGALSQALGGELDLSHTQLDLQACRSLALLLQYSEGLSELDLSHCHLTDQCLEELLPHLHKAYTIDLSHNEFSDFVARRIYSMVSASNYIQTVRLFNNRITDKSLLKDKRIEI